MSPQNVPNKNNFFDGVDDNEDIEGSQEKKNLANVEAKLKKMGDFNKLGELSSGEKKDEKQKVRVYFYFNSIKIAKILKKIIKLLF